MKILIIILTMLIATPIFAFRTVDYACQQNCQGSGSTYQYCNKVCEYDNSLI